MSAAARHWDLPFTAVLLLLLGVTAAQAQVRVVGSNFAGDEWLARAEPLRMQLSSVPEPGEGRIALFIGTMDVSSQLQMTGEELVYEPSLLKHRSGESEVTLYLVTPAGEWVEQERLPLRVLTRGGFRVAEVDPALDLTFEGMPAEGHKGVEQTQIPGKGTMRAGFEARHVWKDLELSSSMNVLGATRQDEALRAGELGNRADQVDLTDYLFGANVERGGLQFGHASYRGNRYLIDLASRGLFARARIIDRVDVSGTLVRGQNIVGWEDFSGLDDVEDNAIGAATLGVDLLRGETARMRVEGAYTGGSQLPESSFNTGQVRDAETSSGWGMRLFGDFLADRIRYEGVFARNTFNNVEQNDPGLTAGLDVVPVKRTTDMAWYAELEGDLLRDQEISAGRYATITVFGSHETIEPQYKTLGAFTDANRRTWDVGARSDIAGVFVDYEYTHSRNNLDDLDTLITVIRETHVGSISFPFATLFTPERQLSYLPAVSFSVSRLDEFTERPLPDEALSGFNAGNVPDNTDTVYTVDSNWSGDLWSFGFGWNYAINDNKQPGSENQDTEDTLYALRFSLLPCATIELIWCESLSLAGGGSFQLQDVRAQGISFRTWNTFGNLDWEFLPRLVLSPSFGYTQTTDSQNLSRTEVWTIEALLGYGFEIPMPRGLAPRPGRSYVRFARQASDFQDNIAGTQFRTNSWLVILGLTVSIF